MEYFDTNLFVYSFLNKDLPRGKLSTERIVNGIINRKLIISSLTVKEFVYVLFKNKISPDVILDYYNDLKRFINYEETEQILTVV